MPAPTSHTAGPSPGLSSRSRGTSAKVSTATRTRVVAETRTGTPTTDPTGNAPGVRTARRGDDDMPGAYRPGRSHPCNVGAEA